MNSQELRNLQEAYLDVYEGKVPWNDPEHPLQSGHTPAEKNKAKRARTGVENPNKPQMDISDKDMARYGRMKEVDDIETSNAPKQKKTLLGKKKPLEHKTPPHEFKKDRRLDTTRTDNQYGMSRSAKDGGGNATRGQARRYVGGKFKGIADWENSNIHPSPIEQGDTRRRTSKKWGGPNPRESSPRHPIVRKTRKEEYDIILSHLLDEGYADTQEQAEVIMVNMSEDWRESIILEQSLPSNYTDYKAPAVQTAHARSMGSASRMRQMGMNATAEDPKDDAQSNLNAVKSGSGVVKPLSGTTIRSGAGKGFKVGDSGINIRSNN
jgi:hypothetical protein